MVKKKDKPESSGEYAGFSLTADHGDEGMTVVIGTEPGIAETLGVSLEELQTEIARGSIKEALSQRAANDDKPSRGKSHVGYSPQYAANWNAVFRKKAGADEPKN